MAIVGCEESADLRGELRDRRVDADAEPGVVHGRRSTVLDDGEEGAAVAWGGAWGGKRATLRDGLAYADLGCKWCR